MWSPAAAKFRLWRRHASDTLLTCLASRTPAPSFVRCAVYTRQSVARPGVDPAVTSCELQAQRCRTFIEQRSAAGWCFVKCFDDEGESGATLGRNGLIELMLAAENGDLDQVVVHRVDRLSRKLSSFVHLLDFFSRFRVGISFVDGALATSGGALDRLQLSLLSTFAEFEHSMISERLRDAHAARRAQGIRSAGRLPLGYTSSPETKQLVPDPANASFVKTCFARAAAGALPAEIAADGKRRGGALSRWSARAVTRMLRNPVYMGRHPDGAPSDHEALVSAELFERAGGAIGGRRTARSPTPVRRLAAEEDPFVLRGNLKCALCRKAMIPAANVPMRALSPATPRYYRCRTLGCDGEPLGASEVERRFAEFLAGLPTTFSDAQREEATVRSALWAYLTPLNRRRSAEFLFAFLAWDTRNGTFVARPGNFDWSSKLGKSLSMRGVLAKLIEVPTQPKERRPRAKRRPTSAPHEAQPLEPRARALIEWLERFRVTSEER